MFSSSQFYGSCARPRFYDKYRLIHRQRHTVDSSEVLESEEFSPRRRFLRDTLERGIAPLPIILRKKSEPHALNLGK